MPEEFAAASIPEDGEYFSEILRIPSGFYVRQVRLQRQSKRGFEMSQLSVSQNRNWEETRFEGELTSDESGKFLRFRPRLCRIFTSKNPGDRWALTRAFECDHFEFLIWKSGTQELRVSPGPEGEEDGILFRKPKNVGPNQILGIVLGTETKTTSVWGMRISRVRKGAKSELRTADGKTLELKNLKTVETTGELEADRNRPVSPGDFILYTNPNAANPLAYE